MSFDKSYPKRKDQRQQYRGSRAVDRTCRAHGSCPYCRRNRAVSDQRREQAARDRTEGDAA
jgi:hypothetical protein